MKPIRPSGVQGTRDFGSETLRIRRQVFDVIERIFLVSGFSPLETPALENIETLTHNYGEEGNKLIFKVLKSGDFLKGITAEKSLTSEKICDKALRYDLTVPLARYVSQNIGTLPMPFRRYQMQPVWRADRPQKGRFREFYQCDVDIVGSSSPWSEVELILLYDRIFSDLGLRDIKIRINHRKILSDCCNHFGIADRFKEFVTALDKLDKVGWDTVMALWEKQGIERQTAQSLKNLLDSKSSTDKEVLSNIEKYTDASTLDTLKFILREVEKNGLRSSVLVPDLSLARGLEYYTGCVFEVASPHFKTALGGGGRYDNLTEIFGLKGISGVGVSLGIERILLLLQEQGLFQNTSTPSPSILFLNFGNDAASHSFSLVQKLRYAGILCEFYPESNAKIKKQMNYANKKGFTHVVMIGSEEMERNHLTLKNMTTGSQEKISTEMENITDFISSHLT